MKADLARGSEAMLLAERITLVPRASERAFVLERNANRGVWGLLLAARCFFGRPGVYNMMGFGGVGEMGL